MAHQEISQVSKQIQRTPNWVVVFGANAGGPQALTQILPRFPSDFPAVILIAQQMRSGFSRVLVSILQQVCEMPVCEPDDGQALLASRIVVCPSNTRVTIARVGFSVTPAYCVNIEGPGNEFVGATIDALMVSAAEVFGNRTIGVLLTGLGTDGREGMRAIYEAGGLTIAQDQTTSVVYGLPSSAIEAGVVSEILPLWSIADRIIEVVGGSIDAVAA
ncbi:MAG: chemotaxis protein CheB [Armatimonadota bacterium]